MAAKTTGLWAPIIRSKKTEWVCWTCVRSTRRYARSAYLSGVLLERQKEHLEGVRFARVSVMEEVFDQGGAEAPSVLFDGFSVMQALDEKAKARTSAENVSDVLDAVVRLMRSNT